MLVEGGAVCRPAPPPCVEESHVPPLADNRRHPSKNVVEVHALSTGSRLSRVTSGRHSDLEG
jgi:hypothetical protein